MSEISSIEKRVSKLKQKCNVVNGGLEKRSNVLSSSLRSLYEKIEAKDIELKSFQMLHENETNCIIPSRKKVLDDKIQDLRLQEKRMQNQFAELVESLKMKKKISQ